MLELDLMGSYVSVKHKQKKVLGGQAELRAINEDSRTV